MIISQNFFFANLPKFPKNFAANLAPSAAARLFARVCRRPQAGPARDAPSMALPWPGRAGHGLRGGEGAVWICGRGTRGGRAAEWRGTANARGAYTRGVHGEMLKKQMVQIIPNPERRVPKFPKCPKIAWTESFRSSQKWLELSQNVPIRKVPKSVWIHLKDRNCHEIIRNVSKGSGCSNIYKIPQE